MGFVVVPSQRKVLAERCLAALECAYVHHFLFDYLLPRPLNFLLLHQMLLLMFPKAPLLQELLAALLALQEFPEVHDFNVPREMVSAVESADTILALEGPSISMAQLMTFQMVTTLELLLA